MNYKYAKLSYELGLSKHNPDDEAECCYVGSDTCYRKGRDKQAEYIKSLESTIVSQSVELATTREVLSTAKSNIESLHDELSEERRDSRIKYQEVSDLEDIINELLKHIDDETKKELGLSEDKK